MDKWKTNNEPTLNGVNDICKAQDNNSKSSNCQQTNPTLDEFQDSVLGDLKVISVLSSSNESILYRMQSHHGRQFACKKFFIDRLQNSSKERAKDLENNQRVVLKLVHPHIIRYHKVFSLPNAIYSVMNYYPLGSIQDYLNEIGKPLAIKLSRVWFGQILGAVHYIHEKGMAHRNIKLTSLLISSSEMAVLSGFKYNCLAYRRSADIMRSTVCNDILYQAPEMHSLCSQIWPYNAKAVDMYALGVCLFQMVNFDAPFDVQLFSNDPVQFITKQRKRDYHFNVRHEQHINSRMKHLIYLLLEPTPGIRITASSALVHEALFPE